MQPIARCNGTIVVEDGDKIGIVEKGGGWLGTAVFVTALVGIIATLAGGVLVVTVGVAGLIPQGIGIAGIVLASRFYRRKKLVATGPLPPPWLVFDRGAGAVFDKGGRRLCALTDLKIERVFQAGSSSKALAVLCPMKIVVARGTPFGDEVDAVEQALLQAVQGSRQ